MKVFLDTNVLVSAFGTRGLCADVLQIAVEEHDLMVAEVVLTELRRALRDKFRVPADVIDEIEAFLSQYPVVPRPSRHLHLGLRDTSDEWIVASAKSCAADVIVSGDRDLLELGKKLPIQVMTPRAFWELVKKI